MTSPASKSWGGTDPGLWPHGGDWHTGIPASAEGSTFGETGRDTLLGSQARKPSLFSNFTEELEVQRPGSAAQGHILTYEVDLSLIP